MASAQQDAPKSELKKLEKGAALQPAFVPVLDTIPSLKLKPTNTDLPSFTITTDDGKTYHLYGDKLISGKDSLVINSKVKSALDKLMRFDAENMTELIIPDAPQFDDQWIAPIPDYDLDIPLPPDPIEPPFENFDFEFLSPWGLSMGDTSKMSKEERERWRKEIESMAKEGANQAERMAKEWEKKWKENESVRRAKMADWEAKFQQEFQPKLKEFEQKMKAWQEVNEPKIKEFESKMKAWQEAQEPKMKEFELKMLEWEAAHQPKMEEFHRKMEAWQKEHQVRLDEFQKLLQEEFQKGKDKN
jgi:hypothetical protein